MIIPKNKPCFLRRNTEIQKLFFFFFTDSVQDDLVEATCGHHPRMQLGFLSPK